MKKKIISSILSLALLLSLLPVSAFAVGEEYNITVTETQNGTVKVTVDDNEVTKAAEDAEVTIVATPDNGYKVGTVEVKDSADAEVTVNDNKFTMPAGTVTVTVTFVADSTTPATEYNITVTEAQNGTVKVTVDDNEVTKAAEDAEVTIVATPDNGYKVGTVEVKDSADAEVTVNDNKFTMPAGAVTVTVTFVAESYTVTVNEVQNATVTTDPETLTGLADNATVTITVKPDSNYKIASVKANNSSLVGTENADDDAAMDYTVTIDGADVNVIVDIVPADAEEHNITVPASGSMPANITSITTDPEGKAFTGATVNVTVVAADGYDGTAKVTYTDGTETVDVEVTDGVFVMPNADVTVTAAAEKKAYTVTITQPDEGGTLSAAVDGAALIGKVEYGKDVVITATPEDGYKFKSLAVNDQAVDATVANDGAATYTIRSLDKNVTVTAVFAAKVNIASVTVGAIENPDINIKASLVNGAVVLSGMITRAADAAEDSYTIPLVFIDSEGRTHNATAALAYANNAVSCAGGVKVTIDGDEHSFDVTADDVVVTAVAVTIAPDVKADDLTIEGVDSTQAAAAKEAVTTALNSAAAPELGASEEVLAIVAEAAEEYADKVDVTVSVKLEIEATNYNPTTSVLNLEITPKYEITYKESESAQDTTTVPGGTLTSFTEPQTVEILLPANFVTGDNAKYVTVKHDGTLIPSNTVSNGKGGFVVKFASASFSPFEIAVDTTKVSVKFGADGDVIELTTNSIANSFKLPTASEDGKTFSGWSLTDGGAKKYDGDVALTADILASLIADLAAAGGDTLTLYPVFTTGGSGDGSGNGGGGGGGGSVSSNVTVSSATNGKVTVTPTAPSKGATVTINLTPDSGYQVGSVTVTDKDGNTVELTKVNDTQYTFTMPDGKVTVRATFTQVEAPSSTGFTDVAAGAYYADAVKWAVEQGITNGLTATTFGPDNSCTRGQMVTFLWRAAGSPAATGTNSFSDVASGEYYYDAVLWAVEKGITNGTSGTTFSPNATVTRGQTVTFLYRYAGSPAVSGDSSFADIASSDFYASAVAWAVAEEITNGTSTTTFSPASNCTRGQIVTFMYRQMAE